jgi:ribonuclease I
MSNEIEIGVTEHHSSNSKNKQQNINMSKLIAITVLLAVVLSFAYASVNVASASPCTHYHNADFDYYLLSIQWPGNQCREASHKGCHIPQGVNNFTIRMLFNNTMELYNAKTNMSVYRWTLAKL